MRLGIEYVRSVGADLAERIAAGRPYASMEDFARRTACRCRSSNRSPPREPSIASTSRFAAGARRRHAIWSAGAVAQSKPDRLEGIVTGSESPTLPDMSSRELALADLWASQVSPDGHPTRFVRDQLDEMGVVPAAGRCAPCSDKDKVLVAGVVTHRQRPATAGGTTFLNLEDETGLINMVVSRGCWLRHREVARGSIALLIRGQVQASEGVVNIVAERMYPLDLAAPIPSRDFR